MRGIAAFPGQTSPQFVDVPEPDLPGSGSVLCQTVQLGVCGTDREILLSGRPVSPPQEPFLILGHECLAKVIRLGSGVTGLNVGDLVVPVVRRAFPGVRHRADLLEWGQFTERGIYSQHGFSVPLFLDEPRYLFRVDPILADVAVFTEPLSVAEKGANEALCIQQGRLGPDYWTAAWPPRVLVTGQGPIAFAGILACVARGWPTTLLGRDTPDTFRSQLAARLGSQYCSLGNTQAFPQNPDRDGFDLVLECTGSDEIMLLAASLMAARAVMVWLGSSREPSPRTHNVDRLMRDGLIRNQVFVGSVNAAAPRDFEHALAHLQWWHKRQPSDLRAIFTNSVLPQEALPHYTQRTAQGIKTIVCMGG